MRIAVKAVLSLVLLFMLAFGGMVAYWLTADASQWKEELSALASKQLGRTLSISGDLQPTFSLANGFGLRVTGVTLANAPGFQPKNMLSVNELELVVDVMAALQKTIHVKKFVLRDADITLESRGQQNNWAFANSKPAAQPSTAGGGATASIAADAISVQNLNMNHIQDGVRKKYVLQSLDATAAAAKPVTLALAATADGKDIVLDVTAGTLDAIQSGQKQRLAGELRYGDMNVSLKADYRRAGNEHNFSDLALLYNGISATGTMALNLEGPVPTIMADLLVPELDVAAFQSKQSASTAGGAGGKDSPVFSREPLPWDALKSINANIALDIKKLLNKGQALGPANMQAKLQAGNLNATLITQPPGATKPVTLRTQASAAGSMALNLDAPGLDAATLATWLGQEEPLVEAPARVSFNITGAGKSLHDVMRGANGAMLLDFAPGKLNTNAMPVTLTTVLGSIIGGDALNNASVACLKADFGIENGIAKVRGLGTDASVLNASGEGAVNLGDETLNLRMVLDPKKSLKHLPLVPVSITGSLKSPVTTADTKALAGQVVNSVVDNVAGQTIAAKIGGMAQVLSGSRQQQVQKPFNPCRPNDVEEPAAEPAPAAAAAQQPAAPTKPQDLLNNPKAIEDIAKDPTKLLNMFGGQ